VFKFSKTLFLILVTTSFLSSNIKGQDDLETTLTKLSNVVGKAYVAPVISSFGSNLNSGWVNMIPSASKLGLHLNLKIIGMGSFVPDDVKTFFATGNFFFTSSQIDQILQGSGYSISHPVYNIIKNEMAKTEFTVAFSGPTIVGSEKEGLKVKFPGKSLQVGGLSYDLAPYEITIPEVKGLIDWPVLPTGALQLTVGTVLGTHASLRYFPSVEIDGLGKLSFWGFGAIHNPATWLKNPFPIDVGIGYFYQKMKVGNIIESTATQFGIYAGKTIGMIISITPYAGLTFESSKTTVTYDYQSNQEIAPGVSVPKQKIRLDLAGNNSSAFVLGVNVKLAVVNINADYKIAKTKTASAGISFGL
jgi:hypothetical protein